MFLALLKFEARAAIKDWRACAQLFLFYTLVLAIFPFGAAPELKYLHSMGLSIFWVAMLLASLLALPRVWDKDEAEGVLDMLRISHISSASITLIKFIVFWLFCGAASLISLPLLMFFYQISNELLLEALPKIILGSANIALIGLLSATLTIGLPQAFIVRLILIIPLYVPTLIFGAAQENAAFEAGVLAGIFFLLMPLSLGASAWLLRAR